MKVYFAFTDECGDYQKDRGERFVKTHPFYVRSNLIISVEDYLTLQKEITILKHNLGLKENVEIKWAHFGIALNNKNNKKVNHHLTPQQLIQYYENVLNILKSLQSVNVYYTLSENKLLPKIDKVNLLKMHLQNAYQRVQQTMEENEGFAIVVADDLNDKSKILKEAIYALTLEGDYVKYTKVKKGLYIDYSDECCGLQTADILAGIFTATLKYESATDDKKSKFKQGSNLFYNSAYIKTRSNFSSQYSNYFRVYGYGINQIPSSTDNRLAKIVSCKIAQKLYNSFQSELRDITYDSFL